MTNLRDLMQQTVEHERADMVRLASRARRHGRTLRRRRRLATAAGSVAVLTAVVGGLAATGLPVPGEDEAFDSQAYADRGAGLGLIPDTWSPNSPGCSDRRQDLVFTPVPGAGEALSGAIGSVADGTLTVTSSHRTSATCHAAAWVGATVDLASPGGSPAGQVSVSYHRETSTVWGVRGRDYVQTCLPQMEDCHVETLDDGSVLRTYAVHMPLASGAWEILTADRLVDDFVVTVQAQAPRGNGAGRVLDPHAVLTTAQLSGVVTRLPPIW